jgi:general stress protein 26
MQELNFDELFGEIETKLKDETSIVLATSANDKVTARLMAHINYGVTLMFSTSRNSQKVKQMQSNPNIALAIDNIKIEATAELYGHPSTHPTFQTDYTVKFPYYQAQYKSNPDDLLVIAHPLKISLYKYINGPCEDVLLPMEAKAHRTKLN